MSRDYYPNRFEIQVLRGVKTLGLLILIALAYLVFGPGRAILQLLANSRPYNSEEVLKVERSVFYRNCAQARAAGAAPIYVGQPGYRPGLDADGDGVACEPYP
jgi:hypothetical protein